MRNERTPEIEGQIEEPIEISGTGWSFEITADVFYRVEAYDPGNISGPFEKCYPPEGGGIEVLEIRLNTFERHDKCFSNDVSKKIKDSIKRSAETGDLADRIYEDAEERRYTDMELAAEAKQGRLF